MKEKMYACYEEPNRDQILAESDLLAIYEEEIDHFEYSDFECWMLDMVRSGNLVEVTETLYRSTDGYLVDIEAIKTEWFLFSSRWFSEMTFEEFVEENYEIVVEV